MPSNPSQNVTLRSSATLLSHLQSFLLLSVHSLLYSRSLYPKTTFLSARAYNLSVHQSRHPRVCSWVKDAVSAICAQLAKGVVHKVVFAILSPASSSDTQVLERWLFDLASFPELPEGAWKESNANTINDYDEENEADADTHDEEDAEEANEDGEGNATGGHDEINWTDVTEPLRGALRRLQLAGEKASPLPEGCTFTMAVELKEESDAPIGHPQPWIPTDPKGKATGQPRSSNLEGKTTPIRSVVAGPLFFEMYMEEGMGEERAK